MLPQDPSGSSSSRRSMIGANGCMNIQGQAVPTNKADKAACCSGWLGWQGQCMLRLARRADSPVQGHM